MRRLVLPAVLLVACGGSTGVSAEAELAAATFLVEVPSAQLAQVGRDRLAGTGDENRLDVLRPEDEMRIVPIHPGTPVPDPFEFVRDPLGPGSVQPVLDGSDRVIAVVYPLIDRTPGGRVLSGSLVALGRGGNLVHTDWEQESFDAVAALFAWGADQGLDPLASLEQAVRGLGGATDPTAVTAADFFR